MPDWKDIGLTGKDILMGVVTVAAGATGGQPGAQGAQQIDRGLDRVLDMAGVQQQKPPPSRMNPEEADFAVRKQAMVSVKTTAPSPPAPPSEPIYRESVVAQEQTPPPLPPLPPQVKEELAKRGYSEAEIQAISTGQFRGVAKRSAEGTRIATEEGTPKKSTAADGGGAFEGFSLGDVLGVVKSLGKG